MGSVLLIIFPTSELLQMKRQLVLTLLVPDFASAGDAGLAVGDVLLAEMLYLTGNAVLTITTGADTLLLDKGVNLAL